MIQIGFIVLGVILAVCGLVDFVRMLRNPNHRRRGWYERFPWLVPFDEEDCPK